MADLRRYVFDDFDEDVKESKFGDASEPIDVDFVLVEDEPEEEIRSAGEGDFIEDDLDFIKSAFPGGYMAHAAEEARKAEEAKKTQKPKEPYNPSGTNASYRTSELFNSADNLKEGSIGDWQAKFEKAVSETELPRHTSTYTAPSQTMRSSTTPPSQAAQPAQRQTQRDFAAKKERSEGSAKNSFEEAREEIVKLNKKKIYTFSRTSIAAFVALCIVLSSAFGFGGALLYAEIYGPQSGNESQEINNITPLSFESSSSDTAEDMGVSLSVNEIVALNENSVVEIKTEAIVTDFWMQQYVTEGAGSGVIISSDGYIVTNNHVIEDSGNIIVTLKSGEAYNATLIGTDAETDLAVLKIEATGLTPAIYGDSDTLEVGDLAVVIGNPLGSLGGTVTSGVISALDRNITIDGASMNLFQTDASVNPGNSGGGIFNDNGELIGIVLSKASGSDVEGLGFAIPINKVSQVVQELADYGYVRGRISTGMTYVDLTSMKNAIYYGVGSLGIYVRSVDSENADVAGFESGDMIYYVEDQKINTAEDLTQAFEGYSVGDMVDISVIRGEQIVELTLPLTEKTST